MNHYEYNQDAFWILIISSHCQLEWFGKMANIDNSQTNKPKKLSETYEKKIQKNATLPGPHNSKV